MSLPRAVARFNKRYTNRFIEPVVRRSSGFAVVHHTGRQSGTTYRTPVNVFDLDGDLIVALTYGPSADWVQNVLTGPATVVRRGHQEPIERVGRRRPPRGVAGAASGRPPGPALPRRARLPTIVDERER